jgi:hypothetical protein
MQGQLSCKVESKRIKCDQLTDTLRELFDQRGRDCPIVSLVDFGAKVSDLSLAAAVGGKIGFVNFRIFVVFPETGEMSEIQFCAAGPISDNPPPPASVCSWSK